MCVMRKIRASLAFNPAMLDSHHISGLLCRQTAERLMQQRFLQSKMACWLSGDPVKATPDNHEKTRFTI
jgi:hypothetical protein